MPNNELFKNKYRVKSIRLEGYDYAQDGWYFVTICTKDKECLFGDIINEKMVLNDLGKMAEKYWQEIPVHFPFVNLDEFIIMPNHVHGIIAIDHGDDFITEGDLSTRRDVAVQRLYRGDNPQMSKISPKSGSLSTIIRSYKSIVTRESKKIMNNFAWQSRFYDHIIRNEKSLNKIRQYIIDNPVKWEMDRNNKENIWM